MSASLTLPEFVQRWQASTRTEKSAAQEHFLDLCALLGEPTPAALDPKGASYTFEKGVTKSVGGNGWADVWKRHYFAWEYKGPHKDLDAAYQQLLQYHEALESPQLLVVSDMHRFEVHTKFPNTVNRTYSFDLSDLGSNEPTDACWGFRPLDVLRAVFSQPEMLKPQQTTARVTEDAAQKFAQLAGSLDKRNIAPDVAAHFLMRLLFCLFAEDIGLLPSRLFTKIVEDSLMRPMLFVHRMGRLFHAMAVGEDFGNDSIRYFDGGLFDDDTVLEPTASDLKILYDACRLDWGSIEPAIFGTLFERSLDPDKRGQLGAHYTSRDDIMLIVEPVLMAPLRREWAGIQAEAQDLVARREAAPNRAARNDHHQAVEKLISHFADRIAGVRVLDPACGSGNFLYVALKQLLDLEKEVRTLALNSGLSGILRQVGPEQLHGIEINPYAQALASVVVWIGYMQWVHDNGFPFPKDPVLRPLHNIQQMDAILAYDGAGQPVEPAWPEANVIIGNPPFLGNKRIRLELGDKYVDAIRQVYLNRVSGGADLVIYWFEKARAQIATGQAQRAGLLATQGIRGGANRRVLEGIKETGDIFMAWSDRNWVLDGAAVHVSLVGFDGGDEQTRSLNGQPVSAINANLTSTLDLTRAQCLRENSKIAFMGDIKVGHFELTDSEAKAMLAAVNADARSNSNVIRPWANSLDITGRSRNMWIIDFGVNMLEEEAARYEMPFQHVRRYVRPIRVGNKMEKRARLWWIHGDAAPRVRQALAPLHRFIVTPTVSKHRLFTWMENPTQPDHQLIAFARDDDYFFGVLHSRVHELWARGQGTQLREVESGFRYTPTSGSRCN